MGTQSDSKSAGAKEADRARNQHPALGQARRQFQLAFLYLKCVRMQALNNGKIFGQYGFSC